MASSSSGGGAAGGTSLSAADLNASSSPAGRPNKRSVSMAPPFGSSLAPPGGQTSASRRKSTLSANGFFIDYSCTRRRSSAAVQHQQQQQPHQSQHQLQLLRQYASPARRPSSMVTRSPFALQRRRESQNLVQTQHHHHHHSSMSSRAPSSLAAVSPGGGGGGGVPTGAGLLSGGVGAVASLAGSRKTSIFDPPGHSLLGQLRRKSTIAAAEGQLQLSPALDQAATMLAVSKNAAALERAWRHNSGGPSVLTPRARSMVTGSCSGELAKRVPVIGCSPTSIRASLAALDETRRYEKLLRKLEKHQRHKAAESRGQRWPTDKSRQSADYCDPNNQQQQSADDSDHRHHSESWSESDLDSEEERERRRRATGLRRKSLRVLKEAGASLLHTSPVGALRRRRQSRLKFCQDPRIDGLSISSTLSFASSRASSLPSIDKQLPSFEFELETSDDQEDDSSSSGASRRWSRVQSPQQAEGSSCRREPTQTAPPIDKPKSSIVSKAMRKIAAKLTHRPACESTQQADENNKQTDPQVGSLRRTRRRSVSVSAGLNYWHYYYYLRDASLDEALGDQVPLGSGPLSESERRTRLYINYSLARLRILNCRDADEPLAKLEEKLARIADQQQAAMSDSMAYNIQDQIQQQQQLWDSIFDYSQSNSDFSMTLSTSSSTVGSSSTSRNSSSLSSPVHSLDGSTTDNWQPAAPPETRHYHNRQQQPQQRRQQQHWNRSVSSQSSGGGGGGANLSATLLSPSNPSSSSSQQSFSSHLLREVSAGGQSSGPGDGTRVRRRLPALPLDPTPAGCRQLTADSAESAVILSAFSSTCLSTEQSGGGVAWQTPTPLAAMSSSSLNIPRAPQYATDQQQNGAELPDSAGRAELRPGAGYQHSASASSMRAIQQQHQQQQHYLERVGSPGGGQQQQQQQEQQLRLSHSNLTADNQQQQQQPTYFADWPSREISRSASVRHRSRERHSNAGGRVASVRRTSGHAAAAAANLAAPSGRRAHEQEQQQEELDDFERFNRSYRPSSSRSSLNSATTSKSDEAARAAVAAAAAAEQKARESTSTPAATGARPSRTFLSWDTLANEHQQLQQQQQRLNQQQVLLAPLQSAPACCRQTDAKSRATSSATAAAFASAYARRSFRQPKRLAAAAGTTCATCIELGPLARRRLQSSAVSLRDQTDDFQPEAWPRQRPLAGSHTTGAPETPRADQSTPAPDQPSGVASPLPSAGTAEQRPRAYSSGARRILQGQSAPDSTANLQSLAQQVAKETAAIRSATNLSHQTATKFTFSPPPPPQPLTRPEEPPHERERLVVGLLRQNSFTCQLVGARQTGKRTIVKCFVKLLNEFRLAAEEYKREQLLCKLVECNEKLQELKMRQEEQQQRQQQHQQQLAASQTNDLNQNQQRPRFMSRARLNSWLGTGAVNRLIQNIAPTAGGSHSASRSGRRHTTFGGPTPPPPPPQQQQQQQLAPSADSPAASSRYLSVAGSTPTQPDQPDGRLHSIYNKSDSNVNYCAEQTQESERHLQVPQLGATLSRKHSDPTSGRGSAFELRPNSPGSVFLAPPNTAPAATNSSGERRNTTAGNWSRDSSGCHMEANSTNPRKRRQSAAVFLDRRQCRALLSLKELNRRRCAIRFRTRRRLAEVSLEKLARPVAELARERLQANWSAAEHQRRHHHHRDSHDRRRRQPQRDATLADSFIVVYSINDRESFNYAKNLVDKLRSLGRMEVRLPIVIVGNKIDLERARVVKNEEGRNLAKRYECKFMEISCTVGFNLDNLLVGLRTQLVLRQHLVLRTILKGGGANNNNLGRATEPADSMRQRPATDGTLGDGASASHSLARATQSATDGTRDKAMRTPATKKPTNRNILIRFCRRYLVDDQSLNYDCDDFSKL